MREYDSARVGYAIAIVFFMEGWEWMGAAKHSNEIEKIRHDTDRKKTVCCTCRESRTVCLVKRKNDLFQP